MRMICCASLPRGFGFTTGFATVATARRGGRRGRRGIGDDRVGDGRQVGRGIGDRRRRVDEDRAGRLLGGGRAGGGDGQEEGTREGEGDERSCAHASRAQWSSFLPARRVGARRRRSWSPQARTDRGRWTEVTGARGPSKGWSMSGDDSTSRACGALELSFPSDLEGRSAWRSLPSMADPCSRRTVGDGDRPAGTPGRWATIGRP